MKAYRTRYARVASTPPATRSSRGEPRRRLPHPWGVDSHRSISHDNAEHSWVGGAADGRRRLARRVTAPVSKEWIGLNREPVARLWVLHGREGGPGVRPSRSCVGVATRQWSLMAARRPVGCRGERSGDANRPTRRSGRPRAAPGYHRRAGHDESRMAGPGHALTRWSTTCMSPSWQRGQRRNERPVNASKRSR